MEQPISAFCFSIDNVIELRNKRNTNNGKIDIYAEFLAFFSAFPCILFYPYKCVIQEEAAAIRENRSIKLEEISQGFMLPFGKSLNEGLELLFWSDNGLMELIVQNELSEMPGVAQSWMKQRCPESKISQDIIMKYIKAHEPNRIKDFLDAWDISIKDSDYYRYQRQGQCSSHKRNGYILQRKNL